MRGRVAGRVDTNAPRIGMVNEGAEPLSRDPIQHQVPPEGRTDGQTLRGHATRVKARSPR